jgi:hypothetical protein
MKKRNTAIRRIVKCIESEYEVQGEFLLWETSVSAVQKGSDASIRTFKYGFKLLRDLQLIKYRDWTRYTTIYIVGFQLPEYERFWLPSKIAQPYLLKLPVDPKFKSTKFRYQSICYMMQVELFKHSLYAYLGDSLNAKKYSTMRSVFTQILESLIFRQNKIVTLLNDKSCKSLQTKDLTLFSEFLDPKNPKSLDYFIENKEVTKILGVQKNQLYTSIRLISNTSYKTRIIKSKIDKYISHKKDIDKSINKNWFPTPVSKTNGELNPLNLRLCTNSRYAEVSKPFENGKKQEILDAFWNARKCVFGVHKTFRLSDKYGTYSSELPAAFRKSIKCVFELTSNVQYPINFRKLFMAIFSYYYYQHHQHLPPQTWCGSDQFYSWAEKFVIAYDELEQLRQGADQIGDRKIVPNELEQLDAMKKMFFKLFQKSFGVSPLKYFGTHLDFYIDWCLFCAVSDFRIAKTYFEHRTKVQAPLKAYVIAQVDYLKRLSLRTLIDINWIYGPQARSRMEVWIASQESDPSMLISSERRKQLADFFARQKMRNSEQA